jgi:hypothetical protein
MKMLWPIQTYRETIAWCLDYDAAVDLVQQTTDRELYIGEPVYDTPEKRARMSERLNAKYWLTNTVERDLRFTMELQRKDAA